MSRSQYEVTLPTLPAQLPTRSYSLEIGDPSPSCAYRNLPDLSALPAPLLVPVALGCELPASGNTLVAKFTDDIGSAAWYAWASDLGAPARDGTLPVTLGSWVPPTFTELRLTGYTRQNDAINGRIAALLADGRTVDGVLAYDQSFDLLFGTDFGVPEGLGEALHAEVEINGSIDVGSELFLDRAAIVARRLEPGMPGSIDYADVLGLPHSAQLSGDDPLRPTLSFTAPAQLDGVDALIGNLYLQFNDGVQYRSARWAFMLPPGAQEVVVPAMPADLAGLVGAGASQTLPSSRFVGVSAVGDDVSSGFDAFRARPVRLLGEQGRLGAPHCGPT